MGTESRLTMQAAGVATVARPRPPTPSACAQGGLTAKVLPDRECLRVVVADDDADTADSLAQLVRLWGHEAWVAHSGGEALAMAFGYRPDVLLLDVAMPDLDGYCLARAVRHQPSLD